LRSILNTINKMKIINRPIYTEKIKSFIGKGLIKVLTGQRRVGKSYILLQLMQELKVTEPEANIVYMNLRSFLCRNIL